MDVNPKYVKYKISSISSQTKINFCLYYTIWMTIYS